MIIKTKNLFPRKRKTMPDYFVWQLAPFWRLQGWKGYSLKMMDGTSSDLNTATAQANWLNAMLDLWKGQQWAKINYMLADWQQGNEAIDVKGKVLQACPFVLGFQVPGLDGTKQAPNSERPIPTHTMPTTLDLWNAYKESERFLTKRLSTQRSYRSNFNAIIDWAGNTPVSHITTDAVEAYLSATKKLKGHSVAFARMSAARAIFSYGVKKKFTKINPFKDPELGPPPPRVRIWTPLEITAALKTCKREEKFELAMAIRLGLASAQRTIEVARLGNGYRIDGEGWSGWRIRQTKRDNLVEPTVNASLISDLTDMHFANLKRWPKIETKMKELRLEFPKTYSRFIHAPYLINPESGRPMGAKFISDQWKAIKPSVAELAPSILGDGELPAANMQDLRDTAITDLANKGWSILQICAQSGHAPNSALTVLKHYVAMTGDLASSHVRAMVNE